MPYTLKASETVTAQAVGMSISDLFEASAQVPHALVVEIAAGAPGMSTTATKYVLYGGHYTLAGGGTFVIDCSTHCGSILAAAVCPDTAGAGGNHTADITGTNVTITGAGNELGYVFILGVPVVTL